MKDDKKTDKKEVDKTDDDFNVPFVDPEGIIMKRGHNLVSLKVSAIHVICANNGNIPMTDLAGIALDLTEELVRLDSKKAQPEGNEIH